MFKKFLYTLLLILAPSICYGARTVQTLLLPPYGQVPGDIITLVNGGVSTNYDGSLPKYQTSATGQLNMIVVDWKFPFTIEELLGTNSDATIDSAKFYIYVAAAVPSAAWDDKFAHIIGRCPVALASDKTYTNYYSTIVWDSAADTTRFLHGHGAGAGAGTDTLYAGYQTMDCTNIIQDAANGEAFNGIALQYYYDGVGGRPLVDIPEVSIYGAHSTGAGLRRPYIKIWFSYQSKKSFWAQSAVANFKFKSFASSLAITSLTGYTRFYKTSVLGEYIGAVQFTNIDSLDTIAYSSIQSAYFLPMMAIVQQANYLDNYAVRPFQYKWDYTNGTWNNAMGAAGGWDGTTNHDLGTYRETAFGAVIDSVTTIPSDLVPAGGYAGCAKWITLTPSLVTSWHTTVNGPYYGLGFLMGTNGAALYSSIEPTTYRLVPYLIVTFNYSNSKPRGPMGTKNMGNIEGIQ